MRISVAIPFVGSWFIWHEIPTAYQQIGLVLAAGALFLITRGSGSGAADSKQRRRGIALLALLFLSGGLVDLCMKTFDAVYADAASTGAFILLVFLVAFVTGVAVILRRPDRPHLDSSTLAWGILLGVVNYGSAEFLLLAVARLPGTVVFPTNGVAIVLGGLLYTGGTWFYSRNRPWDHAVWHGFVLGGAASHGLAVVLLG